MNSAQGESLERWLRPLPFGLFLALALFACFPSVLLGFESFYTRDYGVLGYPNIQFQRDCFWRGELPFWNPYSNCGQPFLAQWGTMCLYPGSLIYLLLPLPWSLSLFCFVHVWVGGLGMYFLARRWTDVNAAGALAGTTYVFNGIMFASFIWPNYLVTLAWMPFVVLLAERAWREGGRWVVGAALVAALQMLSGAPEVILFTWLIVGVLGLCDAARAPGSLFPILKRILGVGLLTAGLAAAQLLPFFELLQHSHRDANFATGKWQLPLWGWANFLVPLYNAFETPSGQYYQYDQAFLSSVYLGGVAVVFALLSLFRWPDARVWTLAVLAAICVLMAFGEQTPVFTAARKVIPFVGIARYPVKFLFVLAFVLPLLAGCGLAAVVKSRLNTGVWMMLVLVMAIVGLVAWAAHGQRLVDYSGWPANFRANTSYTWTESPSGKWMPDALMNTIARLALVGTATLLLASLAHSKRAGIILFAALALIVADARFHTPKQNPSLPYPLFVKSYWTDQAENRQPGLGRVLITPEADGKLTYLSSTNATRLWEFRRRAEWSSLNLLDGVAKVNGSSTLQMREQHLVEQTLYSMTNRLPAGLLDFLGVRWISSSNSAAEWARRQTALPLVTAGQQIIGMEEAAALTALTKDSFDPRRTAFLPPVPVTGSNATSAKASGVVFANHSVVAEVDSPEPTVVVIAQSFAPNWRATVDDVAAPLLRANVAFQGVPVPAGRHRIRVYYNDLNFRAGAAVSAAALLGCLVIWLRSGRLSEKP